MVTLCLDGYEFYYIQKNVDYSTFSRELWDWCGQCRTVWLDFAKVPHAFLEDWIGIIGQIIDRLVVLFEEWIAVIQTTDRIMVASQERELSLET